MLGPLDLLSVSAAAVAAGAVNALAGGGTLITFPVLLAVGVPAVAANITSTVALCPGYLGAAIAQKDDLRGQRGRMLVLLPMCAAGGMLGAWLLLQTGERAFRQLIPLLILLASALLAVQEPMRAWLQRGRSDSGAALPAAADAGWSAAALAAVAAVYGGYFGAGLSVIVLAVLGLTLQDSLTRLNALKQAASLSVNLAAAAFFLFSGEVVWGAALVMAASALIGGAIGGRLAGRIRPQALRWTVVAVGITIAFLYW